MRGLCALVIIVCSSLCGVGKVLSLKNRTAQLADILTGLELMKSEIGQRQTPMPELAKTLSQSAAGISRELFSNLDMLMPVIDTLGFAEIWRKSVSVLPLRDEERAALERLGTTLGRYDAQSQCREIDACMTRFETFERAAAAEYRKNGRLYAGLGLTLGFMIAVLAI